MIAEATSVGAALTAARDRLRPVSETPDLDARLLLAAALGTTLTRLHIIDREPLPAAAEHALAALLARRLRGEPVAYLLGRQAFWSVELAVDARVLVPRPETELLVEHALALLPPATAGHAPLVLELGTGSGAVALALAAERPDLLIIATDRSRDALAVAHRNREALLAANRLRPGAVRFAVGDWYAALRDDATAEPQAPTAAAFDLILSNPPYVAETERHLLGPETAHEPQEALFGGADGLDALRRIIEGAPAQLQPGGHLLLEHGFAQDHAVRSLLQRLGFTAVTTHLDLAGHPRVTEGRLP